MKLGEFKIMYQPYIAIKAQVVVDFITKLMTFSDSSTTMRSMMCMQM